MQPDSAWDEMDFLLVEAYQIYEDETSGAHGLPLWISRSLDPDITIVVEERTDYATKALEKWDDENAGKKNKEGVTRFPVAYDSEGKELDYGGLMRERFSLEMQELLSLRDDDGNDLGIERERPEGGYDPREYGDGLVDSD